MQDHVVIFLKAPKVILRSSILQNTERQYFAKSKPLAANELQSNVNSILNFILRHSQT